MSPRKPVRRGRKDKTDKKADKKVKKTRVKQSKSDNVCLQCLKNERNGHTFCSDECGEKAANNAPSLLDLPTDHVMYKNVAKQFEEHWEDGAAPSIETIYLATWSQDMRQSFEEYRSKVEATGKFASRVNKSGQPMSEGNEKKLFCAASRACDIGESEITPCSSKDCGICVALKSGFKTQLKAAAKGTTPGIRASKQSAKAASLSENVGEAKDSKIKVLMFCRVTVGRPFDTNQPDMPKCPPEFHSVYVTTEKEYIVYDKDAIRAAYLIVFRTGPEEEEEEEEEEKEEEKDKEEE